MKQTAIPSLLQLDRKDTSNLREFLVGLIDPGQPSQVSSTPSRQVRHMLAQTFQCCTIVFRLAMTPIRTSNVAGQNTCECIGKHQELPGRVQAPMARFVMNNHVSSTKRSCSGNECSQSSGGRFTIPTQSFQGTDGTWIPLPEAWVRSHEDLIDVYVETIEKGVRVGECESKKEREQE